MKVNIQEKDIRKHALSALIAITCALIAIGLLFCASCAWTPPITDGVVIKKEYIPSHIETTTYPVTDAEGNLTFRTTETYNAEAWYITLEKTNDDETSTRQRRIKVSQSAFYQCQLGQWFDLEQQEN